MAYVNQIRTALLAFSIAMPIQAVADQSGSANSNALPEGPFVVAQLTYVDVIASLERSGYRIIDMRSTFLGRIKLRADNAVHQREVVVSRSTGEILSDVIIRVYGTGSEATASVGGLNSPVPNSSNETGTGGVEVTIGGSGVAVGTGNGGVNVGVGNGGASVGGGGVSVEVGGVGVNLGN